MRYDPPESRAINTEVDDLSHELHTPQKGSLKLHRPIQCDGMGRHLLENFVPSSVNHSS
jgi:hypothetical protein